MLGTFVFLWGGWPFLAGAVAEIRDRAPGHDAADRDGDHRGVDGLDGHSLGWFDLEFWWELAALVTIMLLGHWQEMKAIGQAQGALAALAALLPDEAERRPTATTSARSPRRRALAVGDVVLVRPGGRVPGRRRDRRRRRPSSTSR